MFHFTCYVARLFQSVLLISTIMMAVTAVSMVVGQHIFADNLLTPETASINDQVDIIMIDHDHQISHNMTHHPAIDIEPDLSSDMRYLAFQSTRHDSNVVPDSDIYIIDLRTGETRRLVAQRGEDSYPRWSPDGKYIAFRSDGYSGRWPVVVVANVATGEITRLFETVRGPNPFAWSPDGSRIAFSTYRNKTEIHIVTFPGRQRSTVAAGSKRNYLYPVWVNETTVRVSVDGNSASKLDFAVE